MELYLCEKPKVGNALARILGAADRQDGFATDGNQIYVTWAIGHLLEGFEPAEYDEKWKRWDAQHLPIIPDQFQHKVKASVKKQYSIVEKLLKKATTVYIATDMDREGESIARELMDRAGYWGDVYRVPIVSLEDVDIREALNDIRPGENTFNLYRSAIGRERADWLIGMNFSRLASLTAQATGSRETIPVGRVLTAIVALVAYHDERRQNFIPHDYFTIDIDAGFPAGVLRASWKAPREISDDHGRCVDQQLAQQVAQAVEGQQATVTSLTTKETSQKAPLPFDMTSLQQYCAKLWGYPSSKTLKAAQELYETHTLITYPRTDCKYLPDSQFGKVTRILNALVESDQNFQDKVELADATKKPSAYNTAKVSAHHAIIPTTKVQNFADLPEAERNVFDAIRRRFLAIFCPPHKAKTTKITLTCADHTFKASGSVPIEAGWRAVYGTDARAADPKDDDESEESPKQLPPVAEGDTGPVQKTDLQTKQTQPPNPFTESSLLGAMNNVGRFVDEPELKKILDEKDGIGTQATRAGILDNAFRYNYLKRSKKQIMATDKAYGMLKIVPPAIASPGMTAGWEKQLDKISAGELSLEEFEQKIRNWLERLVAEGVAKIQNNDLGATRADFGGADIDESAHKCFECGSAVKRIPGKHGFFWGCQDRENCGATFQDSRGKPKKRDKLPEPKDIPNCPDCGKAMRIRTSKARKGKKSSHFWGCTGYPDCKGTLPFEQKEMA